MDGLDRVPTSVSNAVQVAFFTNRGRAALLLLLALVPLAFHWEDFASLPLKDQEQSDELASAAFNSYKLNAPLFEAVKSNDVRLVRSLLEGGIDDDRGEKRDGRKRRGAAGVAKQKSYYNANAEDARGITPLIEATLLGSSDLVDLLLLRGARAQPSPGFRHTALRAACLTANVDLISLLLSRGADPNAKSEGGRTPLMGACYLRPEFDASENRTELSLGAVRRMLEDSRTDPRARNDFGESALDLCRKRSYGKSVAYLRERLGGEKQGRPKRP
ncbi:hypothetical protein ACHAWF_018108 [Thalassiosira exigua]